MAKVYFLSSSAAASSSSEGLVQIVRLIHDGFSQHFTLSSVPAHHFSSNFMKCSEDILNCGFIWDAIFVVYMHKTVI